MPVLSRPEAVAEAGAAAGAEAARSAAGARPAANASERAAASAAGRKLFKAKSSTEILAGGPAIRFTAATPACPALPLAWRPEVQGSAGTGSAGPVAERPLGECRRQR